MTLLKHYECENCQKRVLMELLSGWLNIRALVGSKEEFERLVEVDERDLPVGDFCSLRCLGEWALAQDALRGLDGEVTLGE